MRALYLAPLLALAKTSAGEDFFEERVLPVLEARCFECHSHGKKIKGGLALDSRAGWETGGDHGPALVPGDPDKSLLMKAVRRIDDDLAMPPKGRLSADELGLLEEWVRRGAPDPRGGDGQKPARKSIDLEAGRRHWAFQPVADPALPDVRDGSWPLDPIDRFVLAKLEATGLAPSPDADRHTWLRRVTLDLTGLPPSPGEILAFAGDREDGAHERVVDRLLASRAFGERWARHWLDLTGYADMMGTSNNVYAEHAWRYRDYLVDAYHTDKPFDKFIREQVAGDLLPSETVEDRVENLVATGFLMVGDIEIVNPDKARMEADHIDTQVAKIGTAFLGMTLGCVRCHDHKFDPIGLEDYYGIAGMLRSSPSSGKIPFGVWSGLKTTDLPEPPEQIASRREAEAAEARRIADLKAERGRLETERADLDRRIADREKAGEAGAAPTADGEALVKRRDELAAQIKQADGVIRHAEFFRSRVPRAFAMADGKEVGDMPVYIRGNPHAPGAMVSRGAVRVASWEAFPGIPEGQSGRLQLADWIADGRNPLTARVAVNRVWQKLFGEGLVRSVDYFGTRGERPTHPELLDHLATRFRRGGWSQKSLIRSIVLSRTYRLGSDQAGPGIRDPKEVDPDNRLLWRMNRRRLEAEVIRDAMLAASGELRTGGRGPALVLEFVENTGGLAATGVNPPSYQHRKPRPSQEYERTLFLPVLRTETTPEDRLRDDFDFVNPAMIAGQRHETAVPTQSLYLMNGEQVRRRAAALANRLIDAEPDPAARIGALWLRVFNRPATLAERDDALAFLEELAPLTGTSSDAKAREAEAWRELCHGLLSANEFIFRL